MLKRSVYVGREDTRWNFAQEGEPLPEENLEWYLRRRIRDRLNESLIVELLARMQAQPWREAFYDLSKLRCFVLRRIAPPPTVIFQPRSKVLLLGER